MTAVLESNPEGYVVEAMVPWSNVGVEPKIGHDIGFQLHVADLDDMGEVSHSVWYPAKGRIRNRTRMHRLRLAAEPGPFVTTIATVGDWDLFDDSPPEVKIEVTAIGGMVGKEVTVNQGKTTIARGLLDRQEGRVVASLTGSLPQPGDSYRNLVVLIDGVQATLVPLLKDIDAVAAKGAYEHLARVRVDVRAVPTLTGKSVLLRNDSGTILARGDLSMENGRASLTLRPPLPLPGEPLGETAVVVDDKYEVKITLPDLSFTRARSFVREKSGIPTPRVCLERISIL